MHEDLGAETGAVGPEAEHRVVSGAAGLDREQSVQSRRVPVPHVRTGRRRPAESAAVDGRVDGRAGVVSVADVDRIGAVVVHRLGVDGGCGQDREQKARTESDEASAAACGRHGASPFQSDFDSLVAAAWIRNGGRRRACHHTDKSDAKPTGKRSGQCGFRQRARSTVTIGPKARRGIAGSVPAVQSAGALEGHRRVQRGVSGTEAPPDARADPLIMTGARVPRSLPTIRHPGTMLASSNRHTGGPCDGQNHSERDADSRHRHRGQG